MKWKLTCFVLSKQSQEPPQKAKNPPTKNPKHYEIVVTARATETL